MIKEKNHKNYILQIKIYWQCKIYGKSSLLNLVNNLAEGIHKTFYRYGHDDKMRKTCEFKYKDWECFLEYTNVKDDLIEYKCLCCNKNYQKKLMKT